MASRNVHKQEVTINTLPQDAIQEDRGLSTCGTPQLVLASTMDVVSYKNDRTAIAYKFDTMTIELEDSSGTITAASGIAVSFPHQPDAVGFVIDWRQVTNGLGALAQDCYRVLVNWSLAGNSGWFYHGAYQLLEYSVFNAAGTVRLYVVLNCLVENQGINYKGSGFAGTVRFEGIFGFMQPNYNTVNNTHTDGTRHMVDNISIETYELRTSYLLQCQTRLINKGTLLPANQIYVTDHNAANHYQNIYDFPIILHNEESPSFEYPIGSVFAKLTAKFFNKREYHQAKYDGNISGSENVILQLPTVVAACASASYLVQYDNLTLIESGTVASGGSVTVNVPNPVVAVSRKTGKLMQTGQPVSFITGDAADVVFGRATDWLTLDAAPLHDNGSATINTTTFRFTDEFGGQTFTSGIILDWSTWDGSTVLGWQNNFKLGAPLYGASGYCPLTYAITFCNSFSLGGFSGWHQCNYVELSSVVQDKLAGFNYAPFNNSLTNYLWTNSTISGTIARRYRQDTATWETAAIASNNANPLPCRYFALSTLNVLT